MLLVVALSFVTLCDMIKIYVHTTILAMLLLWKLALYHSSVHLPT
jgi:hypothetical protein